jgi:hypothetical protein
MTHDIALLEAMLKKARAEQAEADKETPHTRLLADLRDDRVHPGQLADTLSRVFAGFEVLGVDLLAEGGPKRVYSPAMAAPVPTPAPTPAPETQPATGDDTASAEKE